MATMLPGPLRCCADLPTARLALYPSRVGDASNGFPHRQRDADPPCLRQWRRGGSAKPAFSVKTEFLSAKLLLRFPARPMCTVPRSSFHFPVNGAAKSAAESVLQTQILTECGVMHIIEGMHEPYLYDCMKPPRTSRPLFASWGRARQGSRAQGVRHSQIGKKGGGTA